MNAVKEIFDSPGHAKNYDEKARKSNWKSSEIFLELAKPYISPGEKLLDLGIGTGLSSRLFYEAGLRIYGMDFSAEMLKICEEKKIAEDLKEHDLRKIPYPYKTDSIDYVVCGGVLHIFKDLNPIFKEVSRILLPGGYFLITCINHSNTKCDVKKNMNHERMDKNIAVYKHNRAGIEKILKKHDFVLLETSDFSVAGQEKKIIYSLTAYLSRSVPNREKHE